MYKILSVFLLSNFLLQGMQGDFSLECRRMNLTPEDQLRYALRLQDHKEIKRVLKDNASCINVNQQSFDEQKLPLIIAVGTGSKISVALMLAAGASINMQELNSRNTALHYAAARKEEFATSMSKFLLDRAADPTIKNTHDKTPDAYAVNPKMKEILVAYKDSWHFYDECCLK